MKDTKGKEYANSTSRFANFDRLAERLGVSNLIVGWVYITKHLDSIESFIKTGRTFSTEPIEGRLVDAITYLTLIAGMIREKELKVDLEKRKIVGIPEEQKTNTSVHTVTCDWVLTYGSKPCNCTGRISKESETDNRINKAVGRIRKLTHADNCDLITTNGIKSCTCTGRAYQVSQTIPDLPPKL